MGKTGTTLWSQVKGVKGQIRLVPKKRENVKARVPTRDSDPASISRRLIRQQQKSSGAGVAARDAAAAAAEGAVATGLVAQV